MAEAKSEAELATDEALARLSESGDVPIPEPLEERWEDESTLVETVATATDSSPKLVKAALLALSLLPSWSRPVVVILLIMAAFVLLFFGKIELGM